MNLRERFNKKYSVDTESGCWNWTAALWTGGYGQIGDGDKNLGAHRVSYQLHKGEIPDGLVVDHICRNRKCVNPDHLRLLTRGENVMCGETIAAAHKAATHCPRGHEYSEENTYVYKNKHRQCIACRKVHDARRRGRKFDDTGSNGGPYNR